MSKKRISLFLEGYPQPRMVGWYPGTPHQDILNTIRVVSFILSAIALSCAAVLFYARKVCLIYLA